LERSLFVIRFVSLSLLCLFVSTKSGLAAAPESTAELKRFQGSWRVAELIDNGRVIPQEDIKNVLPSGGRAEIVSNTIQFKSSAVGKAAKVFSVDPTVYPKAITVSALARPEGWGIYRFEEERLIICMSDPAVAQRPTGFSSRSGSNHMLMVLERANTVKVSPATQTTAVGTPKPRVIPAPRPPSIPQTQPDAKLVNVQPPAPPAVGPPPTAATARVLTDAEVRNMLRGSWRLNDGAGVLQINFDPNGSYRSYREVQSPNTFYKVFVQSPVAAGTWSVQSGNLIFVVTSSTDRNRVNSTDHVAVRSISAQDLIFVDSVGRVGKAVKLR
jgi:uncharacterized protein (TIGR03067 family)